MRFYLTFDDHQSKARALTLSKKLNIEIFKKPTHQKIKEFSEDYFFTCSKDRLFLKKGLKHNSKPIFSDFDDWAKNYDDNLRKNSTKGLPKKGYSYESRDDGLLLYPEVKKGWSLNPKQIVQQIKKKVW